jgi:hypothetical protein
MTSTDSPDTLRYLDAVAMHFEAKVDALMEGFLGSTCGVDIHHFFGRQVAFLVVDNSVNDAVTNGLLQKSNEVRHARSDAQVDPSPTAPQHSQHVRKQEAIRLEHSNMTSKPGCYL